MSELIIYELKIPNNSQYRYMVNRLIYGNNKFIVADFIEHLFVNSYTPVEYLKIPEHYKLIYTGKDYKDISEFQEFNPELFI